MFVCTASQCLAKKLTVNHLSLIDSTNSAVLTGIMPQAELCTHYCFAENLTHDFVHDPLKTAYMCRNVLGQN